MSSIHLYYLNNGLLKNVWPSYRRKRAGQLVKSREAFRRYKIDIVQSRAANRVKQTSQISTQLKTLNSADCVYITTSSTVESINKPGEAFVPSILLSNVMSLAQKIDEIRHCTANANLDLIYLTQTWLQERVHDNVVSINGFNLVRLDRRTGAHGGVCTYIKDSFQFSLFDDLTDFSFEVLWIKICPTRLPRGLSSIVVGTVYHPPRADNTAMLTYLMNSLSSIESWHLNSGIILLGDFNDLNVVKLKSSFQLKQIVNFPTRGQNSLDLILTNLQDYYNAPEICPPFGLSDHVSIKVNPKSRAQLPKLRKTIKSRDLRPSKRLAIGTYLQQVDVTALLL